MIFIVCKVVEQHLTAFIVFPFLIYYLDTVFLDYDAVVECFFVQGNWIQKCNFSEFILDTHIAYIFYLFDCEFL